MSCERKSYKNAKCSSGCKDRKSDKRRENKPERKPEHKSEHKHDKKDECWKKMPEFTCEDKCNTVCVDLCVQKNLLTVSRTPIQAFVDAAIAGTSADPQMAYSQISFDYEIVLSNNSSQEICNIAIFDTLAGVIFNEDAADGTLLSTAFVIKSPEHIAVLPNPSLISRRGYLNDSCKSFLPPCSVSKIVVRLVITAPATSIRELRYLRNTVSVEGRLSDCNKYKKIAAVLAKSNVWCAEGESVLLIGSTLAATAVPTPTTP